MSLLRLIVVGGAVVLFAACSDISPIQGKLHCEMKRDDYEGVSRPAVSLLTGVDTDVNIVSPIPPPECCALNEVGWLVDFEEGIPPLDPRAAKYPWGGHQYEDGRVDTCNLCPYGTQTSQGTWTDSYLQHPLYYGYQADQANRLDVDGNTFRWRYKNRRTGAWVDFRGYYYCTSPYGRSVLIPTEVSRGEGEPCELFPSDAQPSGAWSPDEPFSQIEIGKAIATSLDWFKGRPVLVEGRAPESSRVLCRPNEYIGDEGSFGLESEHSYCPNEANFFACWDKQAPD